MNLIKRVEENIIPYQSDDSWPIGDQCLANFSIDSESW